MTVTLALDLPPDVAPSDAVELLSRTSLVVSRAEARPGSLVALVAAESPEALAAAAADLTAALTASRDEVRRTLAA